MTWKEFAECDVCKQPKKVADCFAFFLLTTGTQPPSVQERNPAAPTASDMHVCKTCAPLLWSALASTVAAAMKKEGR